MNLSHAQKAEKKIFLTLTRKDDSVSGQLLLYKKHKVYELDKLGLHPASHLMINDRPVKLQDVVDSFLEFQLGNPDSLTDERGQLEIGRYLFQQIFKGLSVKERRQLLNEQIDLRIVTEDEHIMHLPWSLLAEGEIFLSTVGWSVSLSVANTECRDYILSPSPKILIITPEAPDWEPTFPESHVRELEELLSGVNHLHKLGKHLRWVSTWEEMLYELQNFRPDILYYYGHGTGDAKSSELVFSSSAIDNKNNSNERQLTAKCVPAADFASIIRNLGRDGPVLAYINCCLGDAGGFLGVGKQLSCVPAVVTNCTTAYIDAAQKQALAFWESTLIDGLSPHEAVASIRAKSVGLSLTFSDLRWLTPVLHSRYMKWAFSPTNSASSFPKDQHWSHNLNRVHQFSQVFYQTSRLLQRRGQRSLAYMWYGIEGQGIQQFYGRLEFELPSCFRDVHLEPLRPSWPIEYSNFSRSMPDMLAQAFNVSEIDEVPEKIKFIYANHGRRQVLLYLQHPPITPEMKFKLERLRLYLEWLDYYFAENLIDNVFGLIGLSFMVKKPENFRRAVLEQEKLNEMRLENITFYLLEELRALDRNDLIEYLRANNIRWPSNHREKLINRILAKTGGVYEKVLEEIKILQGREWDLTEEESIRNKPQDDSSYDY